MQNFGLQFYINKSTYKWNDESSSKYKQALAKGRLPGKEVCCCKFISGRIGARPLLGASVDAGDLLVTARRV
jgi:hypothetical protein